MVLGRSLGPWGHAHGRLCFERVGYKSPAGPSCSPHVLTGRVVFHARAVITILQLHYSQTHGAGLIWACEPAEP